MTLSEIATVRLKTSDRPSLRREEWESDGVLSEIALEYRPLLAIPAPRVFKTDVLQVELVDYTIDYTNGIVTLLPGTPSAGAVFVFEYTSVVFTDVEIQQFLDEAGNTTLAAANLLLAWAADAARFARKETLSGGGGVGSASFTTDMRARELRESAKAYFIQYQQQEGTGVPVEYITEVAWTDHMIARMEFNNLIENT